MTTDDVERGRVIAERLRALDTDAVPEPAEVLRNVTPQIAITTLAEVQPERVSWLWPGRIPVGKLVTLDGDPGLGKSTLAINLAAPITTGGAWPDGSICAYPGAVLLMSAEDGLADTTRPRCDAAGADVSKVYSIDGVPLDDEGTLASTDARRHCRPRGCDHRHSRSAVGDRRCDGVPAYRYRLT